VFIHLLRVYPVNDKGCCDLESTLRCTLERRDYHPTADNSDTASITEVLIGYSISVTSITVNRGVIRLKHLHRVIEPEQF
jgi:hypothetical protein